MEENSDNHFNWQQFQGTELGSLLSSIYGGTKPKINYPKPKKKSTFIPDEKGFRPVNNNPHARDPKVSTRKAVNIHVPNFKKSTCDFELRPNALPALNHVPRRKPEEAIKAEIEDIRTKQSYYRPALLPPISSDAEKDRLNQLFTYKGGKALPEGLTLPAGEAPFEIAQRNRMLEKEEEFRIKRGLSCPSRSAPASFRPSKLAPISTNELIADQLTQEITERQRHIEEMKVLGSLSSGQESRLKSEIASRLKELKQLENDL